MKEIRQDAVLHIDVEKELLSGCNIGEMSKSIKSAMAKIDLSKIPVSGETRSVIIRINEDEKQRWHGIAKSKKMQLSKLVSEALRQQVERINDMKNARLNNGNTKDN